MVPSVVQFQIAPSDIRGEFSLDLYNPVTIYASWKFQERWGYQRDPGVKVKWLPIGSLFRWELRGGGVAFKLNFPSSLVM